MRSLASLLLGILVLGIVAQGSRAQRYLNDGPAAITVATTHAALPLLDSGSAWVSELPALWSIDFPVSAVVAERSTVSPLHPPVLVRLLL